MSCLTSFVNKGFITWFSVKHFLREIAKHCRLGGQSDSLGLFHNYLLSELAIQQKYLPVCLGRQPSYYKIRKTLCCQDPSVAASSAIECVLITGWDFFLLQVHHYEFIPMFEKQYPSHKWADIEVDIYTYFARQVIMKAE